MNPPNTILTYRPDIDGLRALAVLAVVFYHAGLGCPGGFVGVDVFFVISGYLITSLILRDLRASRFSLAEFWERRVRRILPAVSVCVAVTLMAGWFLLLPADLDALGRSAVAQSLMVANFFFWRTTNYFGGENLDKPLLHTWSLAVEEQFYLVLPLLLITWFRFRRFRGPGTVLGLLGIGLLGSLALSVWGVLHQPYAAFFLLPTRAWELLCGSMLASVPRQGMQPGWQREGLAWFGLAGILMPVCFYSEATPFPGLAALPPCLGAAALIWANSPGGSASTSLAGRLLSLPPLRFVGLISYSLYLWHWPVLVFAHYWKTEELGSGISWGLVAVSVVLASLSWRFVETPFRRRGAGSRRPVVFGSAAVASLVVLVSGLAIFRGGGFPERLAPATLVMLTAMEEETEARKQLRCRINIDAAAIRADEVPRIGKSSATETPAFLLFGDSHAHLAAPLFERLAVDHGVSGAVITHAATPPLTGWNDRNPETVRNPEAWFNASLDYIRRHRVPRVILMATWAEYADQDSQENVIKLLKQSVNAIRETGAEVEVLLSPPIYSVNVQRLLLRQAYFEESEDPFPYQTPEQHEQRQAAGIDAQRLMPDVRFWDPAPGLIRSGKGTYAVMLDGRPLYVDHSHLSQFGVDTVWRPTVKRLLGQSFGFKN